MTATQRSGDSMRSAERWGWSAAHRAQRVAVVGATGAVGRELLQLLSDAGHPRVGIECLARGDGSIEIASREVHSVRPLAVALESGVHRPWHLAFLCTPSEVSIALAPRLAEQGVRVIDLSSAYRLRDDVPLVVPEINGAELKQGPRLVANPNCTTAIAALPLAVIDRIARLDEVVIVSFQAASGAGLAGLRALALESSCAARGERVPEPAESGSPFAAPLALNVIPAVSDVDALGISGEEYKVMAELRRILARADLTVEVTTTRVPVERCHSVAVHVKVAREVPLREIRERLACAPGITVSDDPHGPRPRECAGQDDVFVGRIRAGTRGSRSLCFFAVGDQLRKGAALNALQVAAALPAGS